jgi:hypothetical protein
MDGNTPRLKARFRPTLECLEERTLLAGNVISGYIFDDLNGNGLRDPGEPAIANSPLELRNASGTLVGTTSSDAQGAYAFDIDATVSTALQTQTTTLNFADYRTNSAQTQSVAQFNPALGALQAVEIRIDGRVTSLIKIENLDDESTAVTGNVAGSIILSGPGFSINTVVDGISTASQTVAGYDGTSDYAGASGVTFGSRTATGSTTRLFATSTELAPFLGTGTLNFSLLAQAASSAGGGGNLLANIASQGGGTVTLTYRYLLNRNLRPGNYTIVQKSQPAGFLDGRESQGTTILANSIGTDTIRVALASANSTDNNFGEYRPAALAGFVYNDSNNNGQREAAEKVFANITLTLTGLDDTGKKVNVTAKTNNDGFYQFAGLRPGNYTLTQKNHPAKYSPGKTTAGSLGGTATTGKISAIAANVGQFGTDYNFAEISIKPPSASGGFGKGSFIGGVPTPPPPPAPPPPSSGGTGGTIGKGGFIGGVPGPSSPSIPPAPSPVTQPPAAGSPTLGKGGFIVGQPIKPPSSSTPLPVPAPLGKGIFIGK